MDREGRIIECNKSLAALFGLTVEEVLNRNIYEIMTPDMSSSRKIPAEKVFTTGERLFFEDEHLGRHFRHSVYPVTGNDGEVDSIFIVAQDITDLKKAESELKLAEKTARNQKIFSNALIEAVPGAFYLLDAAGRFAVWNAYERDVVAGKPDSEMPLTLGIETIHTIDRKYVQENFNRIFANSGEITLEARVLMNGGPVYRWFQISGKRIIIDDAPFIIGIGIDIDDRKNADMTALSKSEARFRKLFDESSIINLLIAPETGKIIDANRAAEEFYGWSDFELKQKHIREISMLSEEESRAAINRARKGDKKVFQCRHRKADESVRDVEVHTGNLEIDGQELLHFSLYDITENKKLWNELLAAKEKAEESDQVKTAFLANMSHEIRTPMNGILGLTELLKEPDLSEEEQQEYLDLIQQSGDRMMTLIDDLMDISLLDAKKTTLNIAETSISTILRKLHTMFLPQAKKKMLDLALSEELHDEECIVMTDGRKFEQIMTNLVQNALKFTNRGSIDFGYRKTNGELVFYVADTGIGIPAQMKERIFERFMQADNSLSRSQEGAGLGLSIVKEFIELLGGTIHVESEEGCGSRFMFTLPYQNAEYGQSTSNESLKIENNLNHKALSNNTDTIAENNETCRLILEKRS